MIEPRNTLAQKTTDLNTHHLILIIVNMVQLAIEDALVNGVDFRILTEIDCGVNIEIGRSDLHITLDTNTEIHRFSSV